MFSADNFNYAIENTQVIMQPQQHIETFGNTTFRFFLVSELMDKVNQVRVRDGKIQAERPRIIAPEHYQKMLLDGFSEKAQEFAEWIEKHADMLKILRYGFQLKKTDFSEHIVHDSHESVIERLREQIEKENDPLTALIAGVDEAWEVCLLKFTVDMIRSSAGENLDEWKRRGLI